MLLERRTVSRKTPGYGKLEISRDAAERLRGAATSLEGELGAMRASARVETIACTCRKVLAAHEHHFVTSELLKALDAATDVELHLDEPASGTRERARLRILPIT